MNKNNVTKAGLISAIIASVILLEGGYTNDVDDPGGKTKYGITERVAREYGYTGEMKNLTVEKANEIYSTLYVLDPGFDQFVTINPAIAHKLIDAGVNVGTARVSYWLQQSLNSFSRKGQDYPLIKVDGKVGPATVNAYKALEKKRGKELACSLVLKALDGYQTSYYISLDKYNKYLVGWLDKRIENIPLSQCKNYDLVLPLVPIHEDK